MLESFWGHTSFNEKFCLQNVDILEKFLTDYALDKKYIAEKDDLEILRWPSVTLNDLWGHTLFDEKIYFFIVLAIIEVFIKIGS